MLCDLVCPTTDVHTVINGVLNDLSLVQQQKNGPSVVQAFAQLCSTPTWPTPMGFVQRIGHNSETIRLAETIAQSTENEQLLGTLFTLGRAISTKEELVRLDQRESPIDRLELIETLVLSRLSSIQSRPHDERHFQLDNIVPSCFTLFHITSPELQRVFATLSSILTSFAGLIITRGVPLCQHLYTTNLTATNCSA